ncbi:MAG: hypothetical protein K2X07_04420 [Caulobacteraceae bacterium]|nr:hypothetical protein [Caulobacteraceae bacterium]
MILLIAAVALSLQDPPPPPQLPPPAPVVSFPDPFAATPGDAVEDEDDWGFDLYWNDAAARGPTVRRSDAEQPLPPEAFSDPVRYVAQQCRPGVRPATEDVADCFDRVERRIRDEEDRRAAARNPRLNCEQSRYRSADGRTSSTSGRCTIGTGDPALLDDILDFD